MENWNDFRCFLAVAKTESLSAATMYVSDSLSTIRRRIKNLELYLGRTLFNKIGSKYYLTADGENILYYAQNIEKAIQDIDCCLQSTTKHYDGQIKIAAYECIASAWLIKRLPLVSKAISNFNLKVLTYSSPIDLPTKIFDIAIHIGEENTIGLYKQKVGFVEFGLYASKEYLSQYGEPKK